MNFSISIFNIIYNLIPFFTLIMYFDYFFEVKIKGSAYKKIYASAIMFWILVSLLDPDLPGAILILLPFIFVILIYSDTIVKKVLYFVMYNLFLYVPFGIIYFIFSFLLDRKSLNANTSYRDLKTMMCCLIMFISFSIIFNNKKIRKTKLNNPYQVQLYGSLLLIVFSLLILVCAYVSDSIRFSVEAAIYISYFVNIILIIILLSLFNNVIAYLQDSAHKQAQLKEYETKLSYYNNVSDNLKQLHSLRHDFKNHLNVIGGRITNGETEKALEYIFSIAEITGESENLVTSPNETISAILNAKKIECDNLTVMFDYSFNFHDIYNLTDMELIIILGNILDNAICAAVEVQPPDRNISLSITQSNSLLNIVCINSMVNKPVEKNGKLITTKKDSNGHGLGLTNVIETVEKHNGEVHYSYTENIFTIDILIPNYIP